ncbi:hypothetical protein ACFFIF_10730 [Vagococcus entomophilus]|uniref:Uncharacterized protein n=1 Tax=Vagococcus entomophilus TaxID=1160095 RepID=A0A430AF03_9ENTE|nr:hypothetical protein [Vagococcus entomophilus]RSU06165.1 hypothetical protein CBF30_10635 [Vagococcus entomophilus]
MEQIAKKLQKELKKDLEKVVVKAIGEINMVRSYLKKQEDKRKMNDEIKEAKNALNLASPTLEKAVKGQFGKKLTTVLEKQKENLDHF